MTEIMTLDELQKSIKDNKYVVVDFYATWCGPCKTLTPIMERVATQTPDVFVRKLNVEECIDVSTKYSISSLPTILFFKDNALVNKHVGTITEQQLLKKINDLKND